MNTPANARDTVQRSMPQGDAITRNIATRRRNGTIYRWLLLSSVVIALTMLSLLVYNVADSAFGYVVLEYRQHPDTLGPVPFAELTQDQFVGIIREEVRPGLVNFIESERGPLDTQPIEDLRTIALEQIARQEAAQTYSLTDSVFRRSQVLAEVREEYPEGEVQFRSWLSWTFLNTSMSSSPDLAGIRPALLGSLFLVLLTIVIALPLGVSAAIYLEEYATSNNWFERLIQTNINNLAGVPSIIYGLLGLAIFVRGLERFTSGAAFNAGSGNGRTLIAAALTMALLILPIIIIASQEAIRAVPQSIRQASYGVGATKWQTIWHHVLPSALPGILTGNILAMSRAMGETAPLVVIGASTFISFDPNGPFSKFTVLPTLIYNWTSQPQQVFHNIAAAAILALLILLLAMNSIAIIMRNRARRQN
jgi:phosphate transport system permease protein